MATHTQCRGDRHATPWQKPRVNCANRPRDDVPCRFTCRNESDLSNLAAHDIDANLRVGGGVEEEKEGMFFNEQSKKSVALYKNNTFSSKKIENLQINQSNTYQDV